jgi:glutaredoxin
MPFASIRRWFGRSQRKRPDLEIIVYTRAACPLCEEAWELLHRVQKEYGYSMRAVNIDESADLVRAHGEWVPVIAINGRIHFRGHVNEVLLRRILDASPA